MSARRLLPPMVLLAALSPAAAQMTTERVDPIRQLFGEVRSLQFGTALGWPDAFRTQARVDARIGWERKLSTGTRAEYGFLLGSVRAGSLGHARSGLHARIRTSRGAHAFWAGGELLAGSGAGPRTVYIFAAGSDYRNLQLELRTTWLPGEARTRQDSLIEWIAVQSPAGRVHGRYSDLIANGTWQAGRLGIESTAGARFGGETDGPRQWSSITLVWPLSGRLALAGSGGWRPAQYHTAQPPGRFASLGLRLQMMPRPDRKPVEPPDSVPADEEPLTIRPASPGTYRITVSVPARQSVEFKGDLTRWESLPMQRQAASNRWHATLAAEPGVYRVNIRVDGAAWIAPPGLLAVSDGFGGVSGILTIHQE